jgi:polyisoprenoid-binding protein YceI
MCREPARSARTGFQADFTPAADSRHSQGTTELPEPVIRQARSLPILRILAVLVAIAVLAGGYGIWYLFFRPSGPPPVGSTSLPVASGSIGAPGSAEGTWKVDTDIGSMQDGTASFVGYRVQEQLAGIGANTAVGRTPNVSGTLTLSGTTVTAVEVTANLFTLQSDDDRRDGQLRRQALETSQFPNATFKLTQPIQLGSLPVDGVTFSAKAVGELTLHGVTKPISIDLKATRQGGMITITGSMNIVFADYNIQKPVSFLVLSVQDHGVMELQLHFVHA